MSEEQHGNEIDVYETRRFTKALEKLPEDHLVIVENEIEKIINNPVTGEQKKGDLSYLRVHKFQVNSQFTLLGYRWVEDKIELYLLSLGSHENFYQEQKQQRKADFKVIS
jgi:mRNA-degrading endonuclease RelE of RelBE toxin-antitoxin system